MMKESAAGTARLLDSSKEEQRRGITISASAVGLEYSLAQAKDLQVTELYIGNLPFSASRAEILDALTRCGKVQVESLESHAKRGYAYARVVAEKGALEGEIFRPQLNGFSLTIEPRRGAEPGDGSEVVNLNLIDCPGHADLIAEVFCALRMSDACLLVVDATEGVRVQTEAVLLSALEQRVRPVLLLNKVDRFFAELHLSPEEVLHRINTVVDEVNRIIMRGQEQFSLDKDWTLSFRNGSVLLGSGYFGFGASLNDLAKLQACGNTEKALKLCSKAESSETASQTILLNGLHAVAKLFRSAQNGRWDRFKGFLETLQLSPKQVKEILATSQDNQQQWKQSVRAALSKLLPLAQCLLKQILLVHPSPETAQAFRIPSLLVKDMHNQNELSRAISKCSPQGALVAQMVKGTILPGGNAGTVTSISVGYVTRVFSGTLSAGKTIRVAYQDDLVSRELKFFSARVSRILRVVAKRVEELECASAGEICIVTGVLESKNAGSVPANCVLIDQEGGEELIGQTEPFTCLNMGDPIVSASVSLPRGTSAARQDHGKLQKRLTESIRVLGRLDPCARFRLDPESKEIILSGAGELHLEVLLSSLRELTGVEDLVMSEPQVSFRETCCAPCDKPFLAKSSNKHNRVWIQASPVSEDVIEALQSAGHDLKEAEMHKLLTKLGWENAKRVWAVGPPPFSSSSSEGWSCFLVNSTTSCQNILDLKSALLDAFNQLCLKGPLAGKPLRGVRFDVMDAKIHSDPAHRRPQQTVPMAIRAMSASFMASRPVLLEPSFHLSAKAPTSSVNEMVACLQNKGARILSVFDCGDQSFSTVEASMRVRSSFGITSSVNSVAAGRAALTLSSDGWTRMPSPLEEGCPQEVLEIISTLRAKACMPEEIQGPDHFADKL